MTLAKATEERHFLLLDMHHLIADGVSMSVLIQELTDLYRGKELRPLKLQYKDFSVWQHERFAAEEFKRHERYWLDAIGKIFPFLICRSIKSARSFLISAGPLFERAYKRNGGEFAPAHG